MIAEGRVANWDWYQRVLRSNVSRAELRYRAAVLLPAGMLEEQVPDPVNIEWPDTSLGRDAPPFRVRDRACNSAFRPPPVGLLARLSQLDPDLGNYADGLNGNWLIGLVRSRKNSGKAAAVPTK